VATFIEAEDDNFSLFNYVNELNGEVDKLEVISLPMHTSTHTCMHTHAWIHTHTHTQVNFESEWTELGKLMQHDAKIKAFVKQVYLKPP